MNIDAVIRSLRKQSQARGSQRALAKYLGVSPAYLSDVLKGRREPGPKILDALGMTKRTVYAPTDGQS